MQLIKHLFFIPTGLGDWANQYLTENGAFWKQCRPVSPSCIYPQKFQTKLTALGLKFPEFLSNYFQFSEGPETPARLKLIIFYLQQRHQLHHTYATAALLVSHVSWQVCWVSVKPRRVHWIIGPPSWILRVWQQCIPNMLLPGSQ